MKIFKIACFAIIVLFTFVLCRDLGSSSIPPVPFIIIDHETIEEFDSLTSDQLSEAKKVLIIIAGESHGRAYGYGLELVEASDWTYDSSVNWDGEAEGYTEEHLRFNQYYHYNGDWEQYGGEEEFYTNSAGRSGIIDGLHYMDENYTGIIIFGFGWCWDMSWLNPPSGSPDPDYGVRWAGSSVDGPEGDTIWGIDDEDTAITGNPVNLQTYLDAVETYNTQVPNIITIFTTGPVDGDYTYSNASLVKGEYEGAYQRYLKNQAIRDYVKENGGILFDFADILSWQDGVRYMTSWTDPVTDVTHNFPYGDPDLAPGGSGYNGGHDVCHTSEEGCLLLGKALWMLAVKVSELSSH